MTIDMGYETFVEKYFVPKSILYRTNRRWEDHKFSKVM